MSKPAPSVRIWMMPIACSKPCGTTPKQMYLPAARSRWVHAMNRSNPSTEVGGGEMNRDTSAVVSIWSSEGASPSRSSRSVTAPACSTGSAFRQSVVFTGVGTGCVAGIAATAV
jgi:hypothetical protein